MVSKRRKWLDQSASQLQAALLVYQDTPTDERNVAFLSVVKAFEVLVEYGWKYLKAQVEETGLEALTPKDAVKESAKIGLIEDPDLWIDCINTRNLSVHNYFSLSEQDFVELAKRFLHAVEGSIRTP